MPAIYGQTTPEARAASVENPARARPGTNLRFGRTRRGDASRRDLALEGDLRSSASSVQHPAVLPPLERALLDGQATLGPGARSEECDHAVVVHRIRRSRVDLADRVAAGDLAEKHAARRTSHDDDDKNVHKTTCDATKKEGEAQERR